MGTERTVRLVGPTPHGEVVVETPDGRLKRLKGRTDWSRVDALTDDQLDQAVRSDPDWDELADIDWSKIEVAHAARKHPISIRLDEDVLSFFKREGAGYQKRINAVLRSYMTAAEGIPRKTGGK